MKGSLHTDELMRAVTSATTGLRTARRISHVFVMDVPTYADPLFITDAAIDIFPDLEAKRDIVQNAIGLFTQGGLGTPRVAIHSAVETVTPKIPSTIDAAALCKMTERGQITGGVLDGPLAFDNASARRRRRSKESNPQSPDARKFSSCPIWKRAICSPRTSHSSPKPMPLESCSAQGCLLFSLRAQIPCVHAWPPARWRCFTPTPVARRRNYLRREVRWTVKRAARDRSLRSATDELIACDEPEGGQVMRGHSASKTRVNALVTRASSFFRDGLPGQARQ
jgi:hypothetical protein